MTHFNPDLSEANAATARKLMESFGRDMDTFWSLVDPSLHMELPYAPTLGLPGSMKGDDAVGMFKTAADTFEVQFSQIDVSPLADPARVLVEYRGYGEPGGSVYDQRYVCLQEYRDGKLVFYREYFDTEVARLSLGAFLP